jgi:hypothetical protein
VEVLLPLALSNYFIEAITVKMKNYQMSKNFAKKAAATTVLVLGLTTLGAVQAKALDLKNLLDNVSTVLSAIQNIKSVADNFSSVITNLSGFTDVQSIVGALGQFAPDTAMNAVDKRPNAADSGGGTTFGTTAQATTNVAANQVLSQQAQQSNLAVQNEINDLNTASKDVSDFVYDKSIEVQGSDSTQEVLKGISRQISGQTDINAAQARLAVLQNNSTQTLLTQLAAANLSHSANEARAMAKARLDLLKETTEMKAEIRAMRLKFTDDLD